MSRKRGATDVVQPEKDAKRVELDPITNTTLHDLPNELLERILMRAVIMEVKSMKLIRTVWKEKADLVISRCGAVCSRWSSIVTANLFRTEVHRILDDTAEETIRFELLLRSPIELPVFRVVALRDEVFMLCKPKHQEPFINVHDRNNMVDVKGVIPLFGILPLDMTACNVSNCLYVLSLETHCRSVQRITRNGEQHQYDITPWIVGLSLSFSNMRLFASLNGSLLILSHKRRPSPSVVSIYNANSLLQHEVMAFPEILGFVGAFGVILKSNGNLVLATFCHENDYVTALTLKEIDTEGKLVRQYKSSVFGDGGITVADIHGRIAIIGQDTKTEVLDSELNLLISTVAKDKSHFYIPFGMHYNTERNEIVRLFEIATDTRTIALSIFHFTEQ